MSYILQRRQARNGHLRAQSLVVPSGYSAIHSTNYQTNFNPLGQILRKKPIIPYKKELENHKCHQFYRYQISNSKELAGKSLSALHSGLQNHLKHGFHARKKSLDLIQDPLSLKESNPVESDKSKSLLFYMKRRSMGIPIIPVNPELLFETGKALQPTSLHRTPSRSSKQRRPQKQIQKPTATKICQNQTEIKQEQCSFQKSKNLFLQQMSLSQQIRSPELTNQNRRPYTTRIVERSRGTYSMRSTKNNNHEGNQLNSELLEPW